MVTVTLLLSSLLAQAALAPPSSYTNEDMTFYVTPATGDDSNYCVTSALPCKTVKGALAKAPKILRHKLVVLVGPGEAGPFYLSGFSIDNSQQQSSGGILIDGTLANVTPTTGTATGTATSATAGWYETFATLTDTGQSWTTNDFRGKFLAITAGTGVGAVRVVVSNTATVITIAGSIFSADNTSQYAIQEPTSVISTGVPSAATPIVTSSANNAAIWISGNSATYASNTTAVLLRSLKVSANSPNGIVARDPVQLALHQILFVDGSATLNRVLLSGGATASLTNIASLTTSTTLTHVLMGANIGNSSVSNSVLQGGARGVLVSGYCNGCTTTSVETIATQSVPMEARAGAVVGFVNVRANCATVAGNTGFRFGGLSSGTVNSIERGSASGVLDHCYTSGCADAIRVQGPGSGVDVTRSFTGTAVTSVFNTLFGGMLVFDQNAAGVTGATNDIVQDGTGQTYASVTLNTCSVGPNNYGSRVCKR